MSTLTNRAEPRASHLVLFKRRSERNEQALVAVTHAERAMTAGASAAC
jgi:hypothetical protein